MSGGREAGLRRGVEGRGGPGSGRRGRVGQTGLVRLGRGRLGGCARVLFPHRTPPVWPVILPNPHTDPASETGTPWPQPSPQAQHAQATPTPGTEPLLLDRALPCEGQPGGPHPKKSSHAWPPPTVADWQWREGWTPEPKPPPPARSISIISASFCRWKVKKRMIIQMRDGSQKGNHENRPE